MSSQPAATQMPRPKKAQDYAFEGNWDGYFAEVRGKGPRETLLFALERFAKEPPTGSPRLAVDLACGQGRDTIEMLRRGWRVIANDQSSAGIQLLLDQLDVDQAVRVSAQVADFAVARWPACDLVNSSFALPFCPADQFPDLWRRVVASIRPGGRFAGQFFGDRDTWGRCGRTLVHSRAEIDRLFADFIFERLEEDEKDDPNGEVFKHWHLFHIVARKR